MDAEQEWTVQQLIMMLHSYPDYRVLLCADFALPPSPWTDRFRVEIDDEHRVIRLAGRLA